jgi:hypothetical protein
LVAIHAEGHVVGEIGTIRSAIICRLKRRVGSIIWGLIVASNRAGIVTHPLTLIISPQEICSICVLIMFRASDGSIELTFTINLNGMISLGMMGRVACYTGMGIGIKPPVMGIIFNNQPNLPQMMS